VAGVAGALSKDVRGGKGGGGTIRCFLRALSWRKSCIGKGGLGRGRSKGGGVEGGGIDRGGRGHASQLQEGELNASGEGGERRIPWSEEKRGPSRFTGGLTLSLSGEWGKDFSSFNRKGE